MLEPDTKDWTWVLARPCPECGFDASRARHEEVAALVRLNALAWAELLSVGAIRPGRPDAGTWSRLEYACHVRDVFSRYRVRMLLMLSEDNPHFDNWDQDASAEDECYDEQDPTVVVGELCGAAEALAELLERVTATDWTRTGQRGDGASFTIDSISRYMVHDPIHHLYDVTGAPSSL